MKKRYLIITAVVSYFLLLIATIPANVITNIINSTSTVSIQGVSGTLWHGQAYLTTINKSVQLKNTEWSVSVWKILIGKLAADVTTHYADQTINAELGRSFLGQYFTNHLNAKITANNIAKLANIPLAQLSGLVSVNITHAEWKQGELPIAVGKILWSDATVTVAETAAL
ncbi:MAG: type II secretion system protein N, partial [Gammaproteobacteria bacterium]|nr:type II secretion system protein N [Gammaproteobacteria bacterium]